MLTFNAISFLSLFLYLKRLILPLTPNIKLLRYHVQQAQFINIIENEEEAIIKKIPNKTKQKNP